jgi:hypothetical protein
MLDDCDLVVVEAVVDMVMSREAVVTAIVKYCNCLVQCSCCCSEDAGCIVGCGVCCSDTM